jgi:hypothetical protein
MNASCTTKSTNLNERNCCYCDFVDKTCKKSLIKFKEGSGERESQLMQEFLEIGFLMRNPTKFGYAAEEIRFLYRRSSRLSGFGVCN